MNKDMQSCNVQFAYFTIGLLGILLFTIGKNFIKMILGFVRTPQPHPFMIHLHRELGELRKTTQQISKDWADMNHIVNGVRDQQNRFMFHLQTDLQSFHEGLSTTLSGRLREEGVRAELRNTTLARSMEALVTQVAQMRQAMCQREKVLATLKPDVAPVVDGWSQTEYRKKMADGKVHPMPDQETIKTLVLAIKQALLEFLMEAQKNVAWERAEMAENVRVIFTQMAADREDIKAAISGAFNASSQQTQRCFEQLGIMGRDAVGCIVSLGDKSDKTAGARFQELAAKTRDVSRSVKVVDISVSSIKDTLDSIDSQFDEIYRKLELSQQAHSEQFAEIADRMTSASRDFVNKSDALDSKHRQMVELVGRVEEAINRFKREPDIQSDQDNTVAELHAMVKTCGQRVQLLTATLEQFVSRVENPMQQVVYQTKMLTDMIGSRLEGSIAQSSILESPSSHDLLQCIGDSCVDSNAVELRNGGIVEANFKALMREMYLKGPNESMFGRDISNATYTQDTNKTIQS